MKKIITLTSAFCLAASFANAQAVEDFAFGEATGTGLTGLANTGSAGTGFSANITGITADGSGNLEIGASGSGQSVIDSPNWNGTLATPETRYIFLQDVQFNLSNSATSGAADLFGFGFRSFISGSQFGDSGADSASIQVGSLSSSSDIIVQGLTRDAGDIAAFTIGDVADTVSLYDFVLEFTNDGAATSTYEIFYSKNGGAFSSIGSAAAKGQAIGNTTLIARTFDNGAEGILIGGMSDTTVNPIPEPSSYALIAGMLSLAWIMVRRRK